MFGNTDAAAKSENLALKVTGTDASVQNSAHPSALAVDNNRGTYWSGYNGKASNGQYQYIELRWDRPAQIQKLYVYWRVSADTLAVPTDAYLSYWNGTEWVKTQQLPQAKSNTTTADVSVAATRIRIYMKSATGCGISEIRALGDMGIYDPTVSYVWPDYSSALSYNYRRDYPNGIPQPTKMLPENNGQVGYKTKGYWAFAWGPNRNKYVTDKAIDSLLTRMNDEFGYFRDSLGWPTDKRARRGYYSTVYLFGSGLYSDNADSLARGGWQGGTWYNGESWPMVNLSYYPVACFDPNFTYDAYPDPNNNIKVVGNVTDQAAQQSACIHEGIHAVFADLQGCKNAAWFQESGNTSMQADAELSKTPNAVPTSMGFLSAANAVAPFIPIECYSGWLQDGTFGGPSAEGVNLNNANGQQLCTWRNLLGGYQYGELFAHFLSVRFGNGSLPWIWRYCKDRVLSGIADSLGEAETRRLIVEYRAKQTTLDLGKWSNATRELLNNNWLLDIHAEGNTAGGNWLSNVASWKATPYVNMYKCDEVDSARWYRPEERTTPGWSGANQIPLHVSGKVGDTIMVYVSPADANMTSLLCYRSRRGRVYYSHPVDGAGIVAMTLKEEPANDVAFLVVVNTNYLFSDASLREKHYSYRIRLGENVFQPASPEKKWYMYRNYITDDTFNPGDYTGIKTASAQTGASAFGIKPGKSVAKAGDTLPLVITGATRLMVPVDLINASGELVYRESLLRNGDYHLPASLRPGMYVLASACDGQKATAKIIIR